MRFKIIILQCIIYIRFFNIALTESLDETNTNEIIAKKISKNLANRDEIQWIEKFSKMAEEIGTIKCRLKIHEFLRNVAKAYVAIENTEEIYSNNLNISISPSITDISQRKKEEHKQRFMYILREKKYDNFIGNLIKRIEKKGISIDDFSVRMAEAYVILSQIMQDILLKPGRFSFSYGFLTLCKDERKKIREALKVFLIGFKTEKL